MQQHPRVPWVAFEPLPEGGFLVEDTRTGEQAYAADASGIESFAADHSSAPGQVGLGDAIASVAKPIAQALGFDPGCSPCAQRQQTLNLLFPSLTKR